MNRREFTRLTAAAACLAPFPTNAKPNGPHLLSTVGSGRATGYAESNKIITIGDRTHVAWLDSPKEGFRVRIATLNRRTGKWSSTYTVGNAYDNHGGPALTCDSNGYLHIVYYTHHHPFRYRRSKRPNDASEWEDEVLIGDKLTYPTLVCGRDDTLYLTARRSDKNPWWVEMWEKPSGMDWRMVGPVMKSRHKGYAHFQESLSWGPDHKTLHLCCRFHELSDKSSYGRLQTVAYMQSSDFGRTWQQSNGKQIESPITVDNIEVIATGGVDFKRSLRAGCLAVDSKNNPHLIYSSTASNRSLTVLATPKRSGGWTHLNLNEHLPSAWQDYNLLMTGGVTFDSEGTLHGVAQLQTGPETQRIWGDPANEIVAFEKRGSKISFRAVSKFDEKTSHWLPNLERATGHNRVPNRPGIIYTAGSAGSKNTELLSNKVYWGR